METFFFHGFIHPLIFGSWFLKLRAAGLRVLGCCTSELVTSISGLSPKFWETCPALWQASQCMVEGPTQKKLGRNDPKLGPHLQMTDVSWQEDFMLLNSLEILRATWLMINKASPKFSPPSTQPSGQQHLSICQLTVKAYQT
jgi:hypothetical protein